MKRILLLTLLLVSSFGFSQEPVIEWQKSFGGSDEDYLHSVEQTTDGGFIVAGSSSSNDGDVSGNNGGYDCWVVKLDASGNIAWQKSLGGSQSERVWSVQQTTGSGYIVVGYSSSNDGDITGNHGLNDCLVTKLDASGNISWQKSLGGGGSDYSRSIQQTVDGGYIVAGSSYSNNGDLTMNHGLTDCWIVKLDATGNITWQKSLGGSGSDRAHSIQQTTDGGYIFTGYSESNDGDVTENNGDIDIWIVKLNVSGDITWQKSLGGSGVDGAHSMQQTTDGGYIVAGFSNSIDGDVTGNNGALDCWVVKLDASGNITWQKSIGGSGNESAWSLHQATGGGYIVAGHTSSNDGDITVNYGYDDSWVVKLDASGNITWQKSLGGSGSDGAHSIQQTTDEGFIVAGSSSSNDGDVTGNNGALDCWVVKLSPEALSVVENKALKFSVYPNPTTKIFTISSDEAINSAFIMIDSQGREVLTGIINGKEQVIDVSNLTKGAYSVVFDNSELPVLSVIKE